MGCDRALYHMNKHISEKPDKPFFMWASSPSHIAFDPPQPTTGVRSRQMPEPVGNIGILKAEDLSTHTGTFQYM